jgi:CheY-like chemotaxis protein/anti-sigma regulatory factor (Ser/Thr protein kinase)
LRTFYRSRDEDDHTDVDLHEIIESTVDLTRVKWKEDMRARGVTVRVRKELEEVPLIHGNEGQLREALTNLILNAVDAMPKGGTITIRCRHETGWNVVQVRDNGEGMADSVRQHCLEPFFSTKGVRGTGMGLALVYGTARQHGGTVDVVSKPEHGTTFTLRLPVAERIRRRRRRPAGRTRRPLHVLVVDDDVRSRQLVERFLADDKHTVETASRGREAVAKFRKSDFDLVITDRAMPDMTGDEVAAAVKRANKRVHVAMLTGFAEIMRDDGERPAGVDMVMSKPITQRGLRRAVANVMDGVRRT